MSVELLLGFYKYFNHKLNKDKEIEFLKKLEKNALAEISKFAYIKEFQTEEVIFAHGDIGNAFYIILQGSVQVFLKISGDGVYFAQMKLVNELNEKEGFGE